MIVLPYRPDDLGMFVALRVFFEDNGSDVPQLITMPNAFVNEAKRRSLIKIVESDTEGSAGGIMITRLGERELARFIRWMDHEWKPFGHEPEHGLSTPNMQLPP